MIIDKEFGDLPTQYKKEIPFANMVYQAEPSADCPRGTRGRTAVFEMFMMDKDIESIILKNPTELDISKALREKGMLSMKEDALIKAFQKLVPFEEVNKL